MYAIVKVGGKQYRVEKGDTLLVDRMPDDEGATVTLEPLLFRPDDKDAVFGADDLGTVKVEAKVTGHVRGKKLHVLKFKPKHGHKTRQGHRSELTRLEIGDLKLLTRKPAAAKSEAEAPAKKPAAAKKPAGAKKRAAAKKPAAKKPAKEDGDGA